MTDVHKARSPRGSWRAIVLARIDSLRSEIAALPVQSRADDRAALDEIEQLLHRAHAAASSSSLRARSWWTGADIERAWRSVHAAEALLADMQPTAAIRARYPGVLASARQLIRLDDERRIAIERWLSEPPSGGADSKIEHARYAAALRWTNDESDNIQSRLRSFRNVLLAVTLAMIVVVAGLIAVGIVAPNALPVCVEPTGDEAGFVGEPTDEPICPTGGASPRRGDVPLVAFVGVVGASLASAVAIRKIQGTSTPYSIPLLLGALKLPTGALTALAGLILIQGDFVPGLSALDNPAQVLAYSILLGYAQELFTRLADRQGQTLLSSAPGPDPLTDRPSLEQPPLRSTLATEPPSNLIPTISDASGDEILMSKLGTVVAPEEQRDFADQMLADPEAEPDFTPGVLGEPGDPDDDGHDLEVGE